MQSFIALWYSIILPSNRRVKSVDLTVIAEELGLDRPRTVLSTGNLLFDAEGWSISKLSQDLERTFQKRCGRHIDVIVRSATEWDRLISANPFPSEAMTKPRQVAVRVMRDRMNSKTFDTLVAQTKGDTRIELADGDVWFCFSSEPTGVGINPLLDPGKAGIGTTRGWSTLERIVARLKQDH